MTPRAWASRVRGVFILRASESVQRRAVCHPRDAAV